MGRVYVRAGKEKPVLHRHPWVFSGAIARMDEGLQDGQVVDVADGQGKFLARGYLNRRSQISVRLLTWDEGEPVDRHWLRRRLERAVRGRAALVDYDGPEGARRLVNAESDGLPGLVVDQYGPYLAVQFLTLGIERLRDEIAGLLAETIQPRGIYLRNDADVRRHEGLPLESGLLAGETPPDRLEIVESGHRFLVDIKSGRRRASTWTRETTASRPGHTCGARAGC